ncbi:MAG: type II CRISPR-associated endonuclease Cas1 [Verrucomicrobia bacterium]|nr:type II CRISPR-associated endonuclease Cas1 [Verrucomicrobiota bacterium]
MSYHIVSIDSANCSLSCRDGQLTCKTADGERKLPLEDVASIIVTSFSASIHSNLFLEAAKHGVALIICESFKPVSLVLPANRSTDTILSRALLNLTPRAREHLWQKTIDAKCQNQLALAEHIAPDDESLASLRQTAFGKKPHKESICARTFWQIFGRSLNQEEFVRDRARGGLNNLLNYGYAVLLSTVLQKLFGVGLDPTFGIAHVARERSTPLAYDLMEPFRPCVEWRVIQWVKQQRSKLGCSGRQSAHSDSKGESQSGLTSAATESESFYEVTKEFRKWVTGFPLERMEYLNLTLEIQGVIEGVGRGFRRAVVENQPRHYKPWTPKNNKWTS